MKGKSESCSLVSDCLWAYQLYSPRNSPGQNTGVGSLSLLQEIFPTQGSNPGLPHCRRILHQLSHKGSPRIPEWVAYPFSSKSSQPRNQTRVSCIVGGFFTSWATRKALFTPSVQFSSVAQSCPTLCNPVNLPLESPLFSNPDHSMQSPRSPPATLIDTWPHHTPRTHQEDMPMDGQAHRPLPWLGLLMSCQPPLPNYILEISNAKVPLNHQCPSTWI